MSVSCVLSVYTLGCITTNLWIISLTCKLLVFLSEYLTLNSLSLFITVLLFFITLCRHQSSPTCLFDNKMGNETSSIPSDATTPTSDIQDSVVSFGSKRRASVSSTRLPTPVEPPEPDLSNLTEEEISQIRSVIDRAKEMQKAEEKRIRHLEEDYLNTAMTVEELTIAAEPEALDIMLCPVCLRNELKLDDKNPRKWQHVCVDCQNMTCSECGKFESSLTTKLQEWICTVCQKRRLLVLSTGLWHPGVEVSDTVPLEREIQSRLEMFKNSRPPLERSTSAECVEQSLPEHPKGFRKLQRQASLPDSIVNHASPLKHLGVISESGQSHHGSRELIPHKDNKSSIPSLDSPDSCDIPSTSSGTSRIKGMKQKTQSDSELSDITSDVDMEDVSMHYYQDGVDTDDVSDDYSMMSIGSSDDSSRLYRKHRPLYLNLNQSQSATSSDDDTTDSALSTDTENRLAPFASLDEARVALAASAFAEEMRDFKGESSEDNWNHTDKSESEVHSENQSKCSPHAPRSPSWREGLDSPPFSPRRRDSYPGKKRNVTSPLSSPKENRFNFVEMPPPPRQFANSEQQQIKTSVQIKQIEYCGSGYSADSGSNSPEDQLREITDSSDDEFIFARNGDEIIFSNHREKIGIPQSAAVMNLASFAATIANDTANLTQMTISPTNLDPYSMGDNYRMSPDSQGSTESNSPVSPGIYDNPAVPEETIELADPASKPIDYQGSRRQKARPPSTDWSPVIDLSPILDVSPSVEEAEQEDMLEKQEEERRRRESQEEDEGESSDKIYFKPINEVDDASAYYGLKRYDRVEDICKLLHQNNNALSSDANEHIINDRLDGEEIGRAKDACAEIPFSCISRADSNIQQGNSITSNTSSKCALVDSKAQNDTKDPYRLVYIQHSKDMSTDISTSPKQDQCQTKQRRKLPEPTAEMMSEPRKKKPLPPLPFDAIKTRPSSKSSKKTPDKVISDNKLLDMNTTILVRSSSADGQKVTRTSSLDESSKRTGRHSAKEESPDRIQSTDGKKIGENRSSSLESYKFNPNILAVNDVIEPLQSTVLESSHKSEVHSKRAKHVMKTEDLVKKTAERISEKSCLQRQESEERRVKDLKAKPNPLLIQHIEAEECNISPQYKVLDSPPSPESRSSLKRDYSDSTSVSPSSSPDRDLYMYPSPVTPPDSDSSPPKPHSPSSPGTDFDDDNSFETFINNKTASAAVKDWHSKEVIHVKVKDKIKTFEQVTSADSKKGRRKLPPIPSTEEVPCRIKSQNNVHKKQHLKQDHRRKPKGYATPSSTSDESMNEDDIEVAMFTRHRKNMNNLDKPTLDKWNGNYLPSEVSYSDKNIKELYNEDIKANIPPNAPADEKVTNVERNIDQFLKDKDETDAIIDSMINIYGAPITQAMKSLKKRLQDELRRVTEGRRKRIEELEEIRALQLQIGELKLSRDYAKLQAKRTLSPKTNKQPTNQNGKKRIPTSPQVVPRRRHKRQSSDPMISKFSPIKEDKDIEADMQLKGKDHKDSSILRLVADDSSLSGLSDTDSTRSEPILDVRQKKIPSSAYAKMFFQPKENEKYRGRDVPSKVLRPDMKPKSHSETHIPERVHCKASIEFSDDDEIKAREQRKLELQNEIERRKRQLEETSKLQSELFQLTRSGQVMAHSYDDIPKKSTNMYAIMRPIPTGIIKPLDDDESDDDKDSRHGCWENEASYSSSEYLAHKQEKTKRHRGPELSAHSSPYIYQGHAEDKKDSRAGKQKVDFYLRPHHGQKDQSMHSSVTLPDIHSKRADVEYGTVAAGAFSDTEASPPSDSTPAMPLLDDVTARSRKIIHEIGTGSRPVSAEFNISGDELLNPMHRVESDNSVDADEPLMKHKLEGGVTILKQKDRKKQPPPPSRKKYGLGIKRILLTRDPKDKSIKAGNGIGMKIVGGKTVQGTTESGAFVTAIFPGGVADQLHGELKEGDQILEWNGIELSNKTYEDVQRIINHPNVEIELVVKPSLHDPKTDGKLNKVSYDNLEYVADEVYEKCLKSNHGVDPKQLAAQLEGIKEGESLAGSQPESQSSSQHEEYVTPSISSPSNSSQASNSSDRVRAKEIKENVEKGVQHGFRTMGEIQLQLSHDDYDNTLNVHLIQARNLMPKDINGLSDPFVKIYLLPGRCLENKRRSKHISRTLNPQWHQTVMFQELHREELQNKMLEITVWDYDRFKTNDFLGEVIIDLSVEGVLDNMPHWYPLREHDVTTGVELPKPTVLPADIRGALDLQRRGSPNLYCNSQGSPKPKRQPKLPTSKSDGMGRRRRSLGTLTDTDRLSASDSTDVSSTHSSPLLRHNSRDMPLTSHPGV